MWRIWLTALLWGLNWPAVKIMLAGASPWALRAAGLSIAAVLLATLARINGQTLAIPAGQRWPVLISGLFSVAGFNICTVFAQLNMPTSRATILTFTMPLWTTLFAWAALGEKIDLVRALSLLLGAAGIALVATPFWAIIQEGGVPLGLIFVLGAAISWAAGTVYMKARLVGSEPLALTTWQVATAAVVCIAGMLAFETPRLDLSEPRAAIAFAYHVIFPQAVAYLLWFSLVRRVSSSTASLGTLLIPIVGVAGSMVLLGDRPEPLDFAGFALILGAVVLDQAWRSFRAPAPIAAKAGSP